MGLAMAQILDPLSGENSQPLGMLMEMVFVLLFLYANGHHILLKVFSSSYDVFSIGTIPGIEMLFKGIITAGSTMLILGLKLSAPILAAFLLMMVVLAVLARVAPETNILFLSLPLRVGLGLLMVGIFLPFLGAFIREFAGWLLACDVAEPVEDKTTPDAALEDAMEYMSRYDLEVLPVVAGKDSDKLVGILNYRRTLRRISAEVLNRRRIADETALATG